MCSKEDIVWRNIVETCLTSNEKMFIQSIIPKNKLSPEMIVEIKEKIVCLKRCLHFNPNTPEALSEIQLRETIFLNDLLKAIKISEMGVYSRVSAVSSHHETNTDTDIFDFS